MSRYVIACSTPWFRAIEKSDAFNKLDVTYIERKEELTRAFLDSIKPRYIFFPHWNWIVPDNILDGYECVCFHSAPVPYGRGGSPVQNMIARGHEETEVNALRMTSELDAGPVYTKEHISLLGGGDEIFMRISTAIEQMIVRISETNPVPVAQTGDVTMFKRRTPAQSILPQDADLKALHDHIRMLDAENYPPAFIEYGDYVLEITRSTLRRDRIEANLVIRKKDQGAK